MASPIDQLGPDEKGIVGDAAQAFAADDAPRVREIFDRHPFMRTLVDEPLGPFDAPPIVGVRSRDMLEVLLDAGADINGRSRWWAGGFGILDCASPDVAAYAIERGATVDAHAAARLGLIDTLRRLLAANPALVHARGGDGQTPLHVARSVDAAAVLLDAGADIDARDVDHESTPAQYMTDERLDVARHLVGRRCRTDLLLAVALGDVPRAGQHLDADPKAIRMRVNSRWFPMRDRRAGGIIYQWTLGFHASAHQVAHDRGHRDLWDLLIERSPAPVRVIESCWIGDAAAADKYRTARPQATSEWTLEERALVAHAARNNRAPAVELMLECGLPADARGQHQATPLHWAAFHGNAAMVRAILRFAPPLEATDADFSGTPLDWAMHGSEHGWQARSGDYAATVTLLLQAGAKRPSTIRGTPAVRAVLQTTP